MHEENLTPAEREFEATLRGLSPAAPAIDRNQLMYRAGYAAGSRRQRSWQGLAAVLAAGLGLSLAMQALRHDDRHMYVTQAPPPAPHIQPALDTPADKPGDSSGYSYIALRNDVLKHGLAVLPSPTAATKDPGPLTVQDLLGEPKGKPRQTSDDPYIHPGDRS